MILFLKVLAEKVHGGWGFVKGGYIKTMFKC